MRVRVEDGPSLRHEDEACHDSIAGRTPPGTYQSRELVFVDQSTVWWLQLGRKKLPAGWECRSVLLAGVGVVGRITAAEMTRVGPEECCSKPHAPDCEGQYSSDGASITSA